MLILDNKIIFIVLYIRSIEKKFINTNIIAVIIIEMGLLTIILLSCNYSHKIPKTFLSI